MLEEIHARLLITFLLCAEGVLRHLQAVETLKHDRAKCKNISSAEQQSIVQKEHLSPHRMLGVDDDDELIDSLTDRIGEYPAKQSFPQMVLENLKPTPPTSRSSAASACSRPA